MRYDALMELHLFFPKLVVTLVILAWALVTGYRFARATALYPTLGDTLIGAMKNSPYLLFLAIPIVWML